MEKWADVVYGWPLTSFMDSLSEDSLPMEDPHLNFSKGKNPHQALPTQMIIMLRWVKMLFMCKLQLLNGLNSLDSGILVFWDPGSWILDSGSWFWILDSGILVFWILEFWIMDSGFWILQSCQNKAVQTIGL